MVSSLPYPGEVNLKNKVESKHSRHQDNKSLVRNLTQDLKTGKSSVSEQSLNGATKQGGTPLQHNVQRSTPKDGAN